MDKTEHKVMRKYVLESEVKYTNGEETGWNKDEKKRWE